VSPELDGLRLGKWIDRSLRSIVTRPDIGVKWSGRHRSGFNRALAVDAISGYITGYVLEAAMSNTSQKRAIKNYRNRLHKRGMARFEVLGLDADRDLIRSLARRLAVDEPDASRLRSAVSLTISGEPPRKGGILEALRRSPLVGADIAVARRFESGRKVDL